MFKDENRHYSLRKLSVGLVSVLIGISFASSMNSSSVKADTVQSCSNSVQAVVKNSDTAIKIDAKDDTNLAESNTEYAPEASKKDPNIIAQDIKQKAMKAAENVTKMQGTAEKTTKGNVPEIAAKNNTLRGTNLITKQQNTAVKDNVNADKDDSSKVAEKGSLTAKNNALKSTVESNTNDAFALDSKNGLHEHANVNDNGGYDEDYWGKLNINDWNYTTNDNTITITGYKGKNPASLIIPNGADFDLANGQGTRQSNVEISSDVMHDLAKNATRIGLSKTANKKVVASDADWQDAFGGMADKPGTMSYANGGIEYGSPNLTQMDLHNLDTTAITNMHALFNGGSNLTTVGDLSEWNTSNVTSMRIMFQWALRLTNIGNLDNWDTSEVTDMHNMFYDTKNLVNIGNLDNWDTSKVTDMSIMFAYATNLANIGDLSKWDTSKVTDMNWMFAYATNLANIGDLSKWDTSKVTDMHNMFYNTKSLRHLNISNWNLAKLANNGAMEYMFNNDTDLTVIANNLKLPTWYQNVINDACYFWNNHMAVITNVPELIKVTGDINNLKIDDQDASRSIFYDSKGSSDAIKVLTDVNNQYIADYNKSHLTKVLKLADTVDRNDPIALANASFVTLPKEFNLTVHFEDVDPNADKDSDTVKQELAKTVELTGRGGDTADLSQVQLPTNFELSGNLPSATFGDADSVTIKLKHKIAYIDPIDGQTYNYSNMTDEEKQMAFKQLTYHLIVNGPDGEHDFGPTGFTLAHMLERDLVTGKSKLYDGEDDALKNGTYMRNSWYAVLGEFKDDTTADDTLKSASELFNDPSAKLNTSMDMFRFEYNMMDHYGDDKYHILSGGPFMDIMTTTSLFTIGHDITTLHSYYVHKMQPDMNDEYNAMEPEVVINSIVPQNYHIEVPSFIKQESYDWSGNKGTYYTLINNDGFGLALQVGDDNSVLAHLYAPSDQDIHDMTNPVLDFPENYTIRLNVVPNEQKSSYYFVDDDDNGVQVGDPVEISGKTDETVAINPAIPNNYEVVGDLPTSYAFTNTKDPNKAVIEQGAYSVHTSPLVIHLKHKTETSVESLPATRTINVHLPNGTTKVYQQVIGYQRDVITDLVTKKVTNGTWTVNDVTSSFTIDGVKQLEQSYVLRNGIYKFAGIKLPKVQGYKAKVIRNNGLLMVNYLLFAPEKPETNNNFSELQFSNKLVTNSTVKSNIVVKSDMYQVVNDDHNWQLPVIKSYNLKFATNKNEIIFAYTKDKQYNYRFVLTFKDGQYRLATFNKQGKLLKTYSIKSYEKLAKIIDSLVLMNIA